MASRLLMIKPTAFGYNPETAITNVFQRKPDLSDAEIHEKALMEFENMVSCLKDAGIILYILDDVSGNPDSIFPNNWVSFHDDGTVVLYPMLAVSRRKERRIDILESLRKEMKINRIIDLSLYEDENRFLEGTGSIVFDHRNKTAFAAISPRTDESLFDLLCKTLDYRPVSFVSTDQNDTPLYHTNVMMTLADKFAIVCAESIKDEKQRAFLLKILLDSGRELIDVSFQQMAAFAGNALYITGKEEKPYLLISKTAYESLRSDQKKSIISFCGVLSPSIETIENTGGGSVRCMVAELFI